MPDWHSMPWEEKKYKGSMPVTFTRNVVAAVVMEVGTKPEKKPPGRGVQGLGDLDWVTLWFCNCTWRAMLAIWWTSGTVDGRCWRRAGKLMPERPSQWPDSESLLTEG